MNEELTFEAMPFGYQKLASEQGGFELEEEAGRRARSRSTGLKPLRTVAKRPAAARMMAQGPVAARTLAQRQAAAFPKSKFPTPGGPQYQRRRPWGVTGVYGAPLEPSPIEPLPYPEPAPSRSEYIRWVQSALNDVLGLQLPVNGIVDRLTRSAIRSFQQQQGLPVDGTVGPDTERALLSARGQQPLPGGPPASPAPVEPSPAAPASPAPVEAPRAAPAPELNFEWESLGQGLEATQASAERAAIRSRIGAGERNANALADFVFFRRHPERGGRRIGASERILATEWNVILRTIVLPALASAGAGSGAGTRVADPEVAQTLAMAAMPAPKLGVTLEQLLLRHEAEAGGIPIEVLLAFIHYEAGRLFDDATAGKWNDSNKKYIPSFYELGVFQTPAGDHGCVNEAGIKTCKYPAPGLNVENSQFGKGWRQISGAYPTANNWKDPTMQVRVGLWDLNTTADRVGDAFPDLFPSKQSEWWLRMAVLYAFAAGGGAARAFLRKYRSELLALPETKRWDFLRGKSVGSFSFNPENVDRKMALAAKLRTVRPAAAR
jgi:hypothetical protein